MINVTKQFIEQMKIPREVFTVANRFQFDLIALHGDSLELVESSEDAMQFTKNAALYGLSDGYKRLADQFKADDLNMIFDNDDFPDDIVTQIAEKVCSMSDVDFEEKIDSYELELESEVEIDTDDELTPGYPRT